MNRSHRAFAAAFALVTASAGSAMAQAPGVGDVGFRVSESAGVHVGVTAEAGYDSNVFYTQAGQKTSSGMLRVTPWIEMSNTARNGGASPVLAYTLGAAFLYREYLTDDPNVKAQRGFNPSVYGSLAYSGTPTFGFTLSDQFTRAQEPPYGASMDDITRDFNLGTFRVRLTPGSGRIAAVLQYTNGLDYYENESLKYASNMAHGFSLDLSWKWLPKTAVFLGGGFGFISYLNPNPMIPRFDSYGYSAAIGLRGLITPKVTAELSAGYADAIYSSDQPGPSGTGNISIGAGIGYKVLQFTSLGLGYGHGFRNSPVLGNFYELDTVGLTIGQSIARRLTLTANGRWEYRRYGGPDFSGMELDRKDNIIIGTAQLDFYFTHWMFAGLGYAIAFNSSNVDANAAGIVGVDYVKHQVMGRLGARY